MKLLSTLALLLTITTLYAQPNLGTWQWANKAGGVYNTGNNQNELVQDICTDKYGNVYTTGNVFQDPYFGGIEYTAPFASFGYADAFVAKYDKCGNLKWVRFGGGPQDDGATSIHVDDSLNVYILGQSGSYNITFPDSNHTLTATHPGVFWAKYDSLGNIKWLKVSNVGEELPLVPFGLIQTPSGNLATVVALDTGYFYQGFNFSSTHWGNGILEFDLNGNPINILLFDSNYSQSYVLESAISTIAFDSKGNMIINFAIYDTTQIFLLDTTFDAIPYDTRTFLVKLSHQTNKIIWVKEWQEDQFQESGFSNGYIDKDDNLIFVGGGGVGAVFDGDTIKFNSTAATSMELCFKLDSNGNTIWHIVADNTNGANNFVYPEPIAPFGESYICSVINVSGPTYWGGDTFNYPGSTPYAITFINSNTGKVELGYPLGGGANTLNTSLTEVKSDEQGNIYLGGYFSAGIAAGPDTIYNTGGNNAFILKWGVPCAEDSNSLIPPQSAIDLMAYASGLHAIDVNWQNISQYADRYRIYRSTIDSITGYLLIDSVSNSTVQYTDVNVVSNQIYWYRVSAVNTSGETFSNSDSAIIIPTGIAEANTDIRHIALYPNPANSYTKLSVWSGASSSFTATLSVTDIEGREFYNDQAQIIQGRNDFIIDISGITAGVYIVNLQSINQVYTNKLVVIK